MWITGDGITQFTCDIQVDFRPTTKLALQWFQLADGNWACTDRGSAADVYGATFSLRHWDFEINQFLEEIEANRAEYSNVITLSNFADDELIFGADIDHTGSINATVTKLSRIKQTSWKARSLEVEVVALSPTTTGSATLPTLKHLRTPWDADADFTVNKYSSYDNTYSYLDHDSDVGLWKGTLDFTTTEMQQMRRYITTQRDSTISISDISGVVYLFGPRRTGGYPLSVKVIDWEDKGRISPNRWLMDVTFAEVA